MLGFDERGKTGVPVNKPHGAEKSTNKLNPHMASIPGQVGGKGAWFLKQLWCCVGGGVKHENLVYHQS